MIKILVADDNQEMCEVIRHFLEGRGYAVRVAHDGVEALSRIRSESFDIGAPLKTPSARQNLG